MSEEATPRRADTAGVPMPPPLFYVAGFLVGLATELFVPIDRPPVAITVSVAAVGGVLWFVLDGSAMRRFKRAGTSMIPFNPTTALVIAGPYRFTRNPMYVGMACLYVALAVALGVIWALAVLPLVLLAVDRLVIAREEAYLTRKFGQEYRDYMSRVRRWA